MTESSEKKIHAEKLSPLFRGVRSVARRTVGLTVGGAFSISALTYFLVAMDSSAGFGALSILVITTVIFVAFAIFGAFFYIIFLGSMVNKLRTLERTLREMQNTPVDFESLKSEVLQRAVREFEDNVLRPLMLRNLESKGFDIFDGFRWGIQPRINILLGRNGYGKTRLLQAVVAAMTKDDERSAAFFKAGAEEDASFRIELQRAASQGDAGSEDNESELIERRKRSFEKTVGKMPILAIPDSRFINKSRFDIMPVDDEYRDIRENGAYHFLYQKPYEPIIQTFLYQICIDYLNLKTFDQPIFHLVQDVVHQLAGQKFKFRRVTPLGQARFSIDVLTESDTSSAIPIQNASQGTLSVLAMFGVIHSYLKALYPRVADRSLLEQRAIVFIDEIDAHLHPAWQRKIVTLLRQTFPNIQFVLTAHSPLVIAGCLDGEVAVLRRTETNKFTLHQFEHDFIGWDAGQIYRTVFDIEERDEAFKTYSALYADRDRIAADAKGLSEQTSRSADDEQALKELRDRLYYIDKTQDAQNRKAGTRELEVENQRLRMQVERLSRPPAGKPEGGHK